MSQTSTSTSTYSIYVVNFNDDERKQRMATRYKSTGLYCNFVPGVLTTDPRIAPYNISDFERRSWAILFQHLDSIRHFYENTSADYCVVCEDDIYVSREFQQKMPEVMRAAKTHNLGIMLLGYLWPHSNFHGNGWFPVIGNTDSGMELRTYPNDLWGAHMYMVSRDHAKDMLEHFTPEYAYSCCGTERPFCSDWQITKYGNRALLWPVLGVEEGEVKTDHQGQIDYHRQCTAAHYDATKFV